MENILGYPVCAQDLPACMERIGGWLDAAGPARAFVCANPHSLITAMGDAEFSAALRAADLVTPDGVGIVLASRWQGGRIRQRITGSDIFEALSHHMNTQGGYSVFFLGSTEETLAAIRARMQALYPNVRVAGTYSPPFRERFTEEDCRQMREAVNAAKPHVLWVGMTAPKQEKWIHQNLAQLDVRFVGAIGAVFDFFTGRIKRSPPIFRKLGLEWLPRLLQEPRRLWNRNFISSRKFVCYVLRGVGRK